MSVKVLSLKDNRGKIRLARRPALPDAAAAAAGGGGGGADASGSGSDAAAAGVGVTPPAA
jgi:hypothetical protein